MVLRIDFGTGPREVGLEDFPIAVGLSPQGGLVFGEAAEPSPSLWLGHNGGRIFAQAEGRVRGLTHNDEALEGSVWIDAGDRLRIGDRTIAVSQADGVLVLSTLAPQGASAEPGVSAPIPPRPAPAGPAVPPPGRRRARRIAYGFLAALLLGAGFVVTASPVRIAIDPAPDSTSMTGNFPPIYVFGRYLALPGVYRIEARKSGYHRLEQTLTVGFGSEPELSLRMRKLPGFLTVRSRPLDGARVWADGVEVGNTPVGPLELEAGRHEIRLTAERYKPFKQMVEIEGMGNRQALEATLRAGWGTLLVTSVPDGASVTLNREAVGTTPFRAEPMEGRYRIWLTKKGWKPVTREVAVTAGAVTRLPLIRFEKQDGVIDLKTVPKGALVLLDGEFRGKSPTRLTVAADRDHRLRLTKPGYVSVSRTVTAGPGVVRPVQVEMRAQYGIVFITARPADAQLKLDGRSMGRASRRLRLMTLPHRIEISRDGYQPYSTTVTPKPGVSSRLNVRLKTLRSVKRAEAERAAKTGGGQRMLPVWLDRPVRFRIGASRREAGRRSNEAQYEVELTRSFFIGALEVSNEDFRRFRPKHNSGSQQGIDLNAPRLPVASVSWDDAARYLNWLSKKDSLPPAYREENGKMAAVVPMNTGYRLPTEAEWVYAARFEAGRRPPGQPLKYPWGNAMPPTSKAGNFADETAAKQIPMTLPGYADGFPAAAPVGRFPANKAGIHDLGGNVSEWGHDFYDVRTIGTAAPLRDPGGPARGLYHVVRGSSWRHGSVTQLRFSYRDFEQKSRNDLGFRVARYAN